MKTIGQILKNARLEAKFSLKELASITKIKSSFIALIENETWEDLPPFPIVLGFVKSIAGVIKIDENLVVSIFKRDYPPKKIRISPKPDVVSRTFLNPKSTFILSVATILVIFFGYLIFQYVKFVSPPSISVESPKEGQLVKQQEEVVVFGKTDADTKILVNNQPVLVNPDGNFSVNLSVSVNTKEIVIVGTSRSGKVTTVYRKITVN